MTLVSYRIVTVFFFTSLSPSDRDPSAAGPPQSLIDYTFPVILLNYVLLCFGQPRRDRPIWLERVPFPLPFKFSARLNTPA